MTQFESSIPCKARIATLAVAALAFLSTGFDDSPNRYETRFNTLDTNGDRQLQVDEYVQHLPAREAILRRDFRLFDFDRSGTLALNEFMTTPLVARSEDRGQLPDPMDAFVDHAVAAMDHSFDAWDLHPEREVPAWTFVQLFISTFGSQSTRPQVDDVDENRNGSISRREARRFLEIQAGVRRNDGKLLRRPDGNVINLGLFLHVDQDRDDRIGQAEFEKVIRSGTSFAEVIRQVDADSDDQISFDEWSTIPGRGLTSPVNEFRRLDRNLDARIDRKELADGSPKWKQQMTSCVFPGFDTDADGTLSLDEFRMTMLANPCLRWHVPVADSDGDHELTFSEFQFDSSRCVLLRWLYFNRLDRNDDGVLTTDEFNFRVKTPDEFFIVNADGTGWQSLFRFETHFACGSPAVSPDGRSLLFDAWKVKPRSSPTIFRLEIGTKKPRKISSGSMPNWSPDGSQLVCSQSGIRIMNADGWKSVEIRDRGWGAQWSPDGRTIAFTEGPVVRAYNVETKEFRTILGNHDYQRIYWNMTWSPNSRFICFKGEKADGSSEVVTLDVISEEPSLRVHHSTRLNVNADFAWHPLGDRIVFGMHCPERRKTQLYEFHPEKDEPPILFPGQDEDRNNTDVCWTPDGKQLIVVSGDF